ncbi:MAG: hypothetical protein D6B28_11670 [Gammaproteobacteria bacterium]|nr:MAG: hypothetical protein D6B28_11670 [Gammaproteobacteria bacterium]
MPFSIQNVVKYFIVLGSALFLNACGGGGGGGDSQSPDTAPQQTYAMSGTVSGLTGTGLILQLSTGETYEIEADGEFTFPAQVPEGTTYTITVNSHPTGDEQNQVCEVENGTGTVNGDVSNIAVTCTDSQPVSGTVAGLAEGATLSLVNSNGDQLVVTAGGAIEFGAEVAEGADYEITVATQPTTPNQICTVANASGTVADSAVTDIEITCVNSYTIGGTISGLAGSGLVIQNNGGDNISVTENGNFTFATAQIDATDYAVTVQINPTVPNQTCIVTNGSGTIADTDVTNVVVVCTTNKYTVGGTATGVAGNGLVLQNNAGDDLAVAANGDFTFATAIDDLSAYEVTVISNPSTPNQTCTVTNESGNLAGGNTTSVAVNCVTNKYSIGGTVTGLEGSGLIIQNNSGDNTEINASGAFTLATRLDDMSAYDVTVIQNPTDPVQICTPSSASGDIAGAAITTIEIDCYTPIALEVENHSRSVIAKWDDKEGMRKYNLYYSPNPGLTPESCASDDDCMQIASVNSPSTIVNLKNDTTYEVVVEGIEQGTEKSHVSLTAIAAPKEWGFYHNDRGAEVEKMFLGDDGSVYFLGNFNNVSGYERNRFAAVNPDGTLSQLSLNTDFFGEYADKFVVSDGVLYIDDGNYARKTTGVIAINLETGEEVFSTKLKRWDDDREFWQTPFVNGVTVIDEVLYVTGYFNRVGEGEVIRNGVAAFDKNTGELLGWDPDLCPDGSHCNAGFLSIDNGYLYFGYQDEYENTKDNRYLAKVANNNYDDVTMFPIEGWVTEIAFDGDDMVLAGGISEFNGLECPYGLISASKSGNEVNWGQYVYQLDENDEFKYTTRQIAMTDNTIVVSGNFITVGINGEETARNHLAFFDKQGNLLPIDFECDYGHYDGCDMNDLLVVGDKIYMAGYFKLVNGKTGSAGLIVINEQGEIQ